MYLKRVEIQGFKSFADKTIIEFKNEVTAIVGPNGSGKSNISDAIRWVLGEQSVRYLRGSKMEDVIFSGTDKRKPLGFAEVTIIFDNSDHSIPIEYNEVAISRRMFRSGESEYLINKNSCRLKDIRRLIMDTGIGKEGYSIIGQGRIDEILSNRPEDRRNIFEEAAGIVKYKTKKEEAERKLNNTEENLIRIKDLVGEIRSQYKKLELESNKATEFAGVYDELKELEINLYLKEIKDIDKRTKELNLRILDINQKINDSEISRVDLEKKFDSIKLELDTYDNNIEELRNQKLNIYRSYEKSVNDVSLISERERFINQDLERLSAEKEDLKDYIKKNLEKIDDGKLDIDSISDYYKKTLDNYNLENANLMDLKGLLKEKSISMEENQKKTNFLSNEISTKKNQIYNINNKYKDTIEQINKIQEEMVLTEKRIQENIAEIVTLDTKIKSVEDKLLEINMYKNDNETIKTNLLHEKDDISNNIRNIEIELNGLNSNLRLFQNMEENYEGYYKSVRNLLRSVKDNKNLNAGFRGSIAELLKVEKKYERAIDVSLGSSIQNIVVEKEIDAKKLIEYLKKNNLGRVTFLPLNTINGKILNINRNIFKKYGVIGLGHEIIQYSREYENIFKHLLGRTLIIDSLDNAINLCKDYGYVYKIVTLDGEVINPGGSLTGGSFSLNTVNILNRKNRMIEIEKDLVIYNEKLESLKKKEELVLDNLKTIVAKIDISLLDIKNLEMQSINLLNQKSSYSKECNELESLLSKNYTNINTLELDLKTLGSIKKRDEGGLATLLLEIEALKETRDKYSDEYNNYTNLEAEISRKVSDLRLEVNTIENKLSNAREKDITIKDDIKDKENLIMEKNNQINKLKKDIINISISKAELLNTVKERKSEQKDTDKLLEASLVEKEILMEEFYSQQKAIEIINKDISTYDRQKNQIDLKLSKLSLESENNIRRLYDNYELSIEDAAIYEKKIEDIEGVKLKIKLLKSNIKDLGSVNLSAIEDFKIVKDRLKFLEQQYNDLESSKDGLKEIINDMEVKMRRIFSKSFHEINENFSEVFAILFNGGKASLKLDDEDVLKSGIEIEVQPPGKRLQNINLLSGGEKSLTAVAILFAILKTKPSPFCILDEIDAALDEANISRYTDYLKSFREDTQFILITHRKTTMEIANVLYGVTMENEGVSKLISVKLKDYLNDVAS